MPTAELFPPTACDQIIRLIQMCFSLKIQQRFSVFGTRFDVSNIIISHFKCIEKFYKTIGIYNYSYTMNLYELEYLLTVKLI